jgi:hypothetical protein
MITIFGIPKPFTGEFAVIQRNAILSWLKLKPACEVILLGNETGVAEFAAEHHIKHLPDVAVSTFGTPLIADAHNKVKQAARFGIHAYLNSDIILMQDFIEAVMKVKNLPTFFIGGQRTDTNLNTPIDFQNQDWASQVMAVVKKEGVLHGPAGMDYFVFPDTIPFHFPAGFAAGRPGGDNWTVYRIRSLNIPFIDATAVVTAVHQAHGHSHLQGSADRWEGPESAENRRLAGGYAYVFTLEDATLLLTPEGLKRPPFTVVRLARYFETLPALRPQMGSWPKAVSLLLQPRRLAGKIMRTLKLR